MAEFDDDTAPHSSLNPETSEERLHDAEGRLSAVESLVEHIPRIERVLLSVQGDARRAERAARAFEQRVEAKLDELLALVRARAPSP